MSTLLTNFIHLKKDDEYQLFYSVDMYKSASGDITPATSQITITQLMTEVYNWAMSVDGSLKLYRQIPTDNSLICLTGLMGASNGSLIWGGIILMCLYYLFGPLDQAAAVFFGLNQNNTYYSEVTNRNPSSLLVDTGSGNLYAMSEFDLLYLSNKESFITNYLTVVVDELAYVINNSQNASWYISLSGFYIYPVMSFISLQSGSYDLWYTLAYPNSANYETTKIVLTYNNNTVEFESLNDYINLEQGNSRYGLVGNNDEDGAFPIWDEDEYWNTDLDYLTEAKIIQIYNFFMSSSSNSRIHIEMYGKGTPST